MNKKMITLTMAAIFAGIALTGCQPKEGDPTTTTGDSKTGSMTTDAKPADAGATTNEGGAGTTEGGAATTEAPKTEDGK